MKAADITNHEKGYPRELFDFKKRSLSYSSMKHILTSPAHFAENWTAPRTPPTAAMLDGTLVDMFITEKEKYDSSVILSPKFDMKSTVGVLEYVQFIQEAIKKKPDHRHLEHAAVKEDATLMPLKELRALKDVLNEIHGLYFVDAEEKNTIEYLANHIMEHPRVKRLLDNATSTQRELRWVDSKTGLPLRGFLDIETELDDKAVLVDLKGIVSADMDKIQRQVFDLKYALQAYCYQTAYAKKYGVFPDFYFVFFEKELPFGIQVVRCGADIMKLGQHWYRKALDSIKYCIVNDCFDMGYEFNNMDMDYADLQLAGWMKRELE